MQIGRGDTDIEPAVGVFMPVRPTDSIALQTHDGEFVAALERELRGRGPSMTLRGTSRLASIRTLHIPSSGIVLLGFQDDEVHALPEMGTKVIVASRKTRGMSRRASASPSRSSPTTGSHAGGLSASPMRRRADARK